MTSFVRTDTGDDSGILHLLQMLGYGAAVYAEAFGHLG